MDANRQSIVPQDLNQSFQLPHSVSQSKLSRINIPTFNGNILNFANFRGLFENLVHSNTELSNVQKLYCIFGPLLILKGRHIVLSPPWRMLPILLLTNIILNITL